MIPFRDNPLDRKGRLKFLRASPALLNGLAKEKQRKRSGSDLFLA